MDSKMTRGEHVGERALGKTAAGAGNVPKGGVKKGGGGKMEMGSIGGAVKMLNALKKGEPRCG